MRVIHGAMNSATGPLTYSLVADYVPPERRATANAVLGTAVYAGVSLSSLSILLIKRAGWRFSYQFMGAAGIVLGLLTALIVKEPKKGTKMYDSVANLDPSESTRDLDKLASEVSKNRIEEKTGFL